MLFALDGGGVGAATEQEVRGIAFCTALAPGASLGAGARVSPAAAAHSSHDHATRTFSRTRLPPKTPQRPARCADSQHLADLERRVLAATLGRTEEEEKVR